MSNWKLGLTEEMQAKLAERNQAEDVESRLAGALSEVFVFGADWRERNPNRPVTVLEMFQVHLFRQMGEETTAQIVLDYILHGKKSDRKEKCCDCMTTPETKQI